MITIHQKIKYTYLSVDVATKSLAIGLYQIEDTDNVDIKIIPLAMNVFDLDSEKKSKDMTIEAKANALKIVLTSFDKFIPDTILYKVLIEYQMNANHMSNAIFNMIVFHYAGRAPIYTVFPSLKNSVYLHSSLKLSDFLATSNSNYIANKNHCKYNFLYFIVLFEHGCMIKSIKQKNIDDIADTFMQCLAFHKTHKE